MEEPAVTEFIDLVYEAAVDADLWPRVLRRFGEFVGAASANLPHVNYQAARGSLILVDLDPEFTTQYLANWVMRHPWRAYGAMPEARWDRMVVTDEQLVSKDELVRTPYYNEFLRPFEIHSALAIGLGRNGSTAANANFLRPAGRERFQDTEVQLARTVQPHLTRAFKVSQRLAEARVLNDDLTAWAEGSPHGLFLLDESGAILNLNAAARKLLDETQGLRVSRGRLTAQAPNVARTLEGLIAKVGIEGGGGSLRLTTPGRPRPLLLTVTAGPRRDPSPLYPRRSIIVCAHDSDAGARPSEHALRDVYGLTPAEARVTLALAEGLSPREISEAFGVSPHTVHRQLAHVFDKTDTRRQSELVALVLRSAGLQAN